MNLLQKIRKLPAISQSHLIVGIRYHYTRDNYRLVECEELHDILVEGNKPGFKVLHAYSSDNRANYMREVTNFLVHGHIKGAYFVNLHDISNLNSPYHNTVPSDEQFSLYMQHADIGKSDKLVIYDETIMVSTRLHWLFNVFGHTNLYYLNGGLRRWKYLGLPLEKGFSQTNTRISQRESQNFEYSLDKSKVIEFDEMSRLNDNYQEQKEFQILDSRRTAQHIEGKQSKWTHIPVMDELFREDGRFKDVKELREIFEENDIDFSKTIVQTCRRGLQATASNFACDLVCKAAKINYTSKLYDCSWEEWMVKRYKK